MVPKREELKGSMIGLVGVGPDAAGDTDFVARAALRVCGVGVAA